MVPTSDIGWLYMYASLGRQLSRQKLIALSKLHTSATTSVVYTPSWGVLDCCCRYCCHAAAVDVPEPVLLYFWGRRRRQQLTLIDTRRV